MILKEGDLKLLYRSWIFFLLYSLFIVNQSLVVVEFVEFLFELGGSDAVLDAFELSIFVGIAKFSAESFRALFVNTSKTGLCSTSCGLLVVAWTS